MKKKFVYCFDRHREPEHWVSTAAATAVDLYLVWFSLITASVCYPASLVGGEDGSGHPHQQRRQVPGKHRPCLGGIGDAVGGVWLRYPGR